MSMEIYMTTYMTTPTIAYLFMYINLSYLYDSYSQNLYEMLIIPEDASNS